MKVDVRFESMPKEVRAAAKPTFDAFLWLVPTWCHTLTVTFESTAEVDTAASCDAQPEYRQAHIALHQGWLTEDDKGRRRYIIHELCHLVVAPLALLTDSIVGKVFTDAGKPILEEQARVALEGVVQDLAYLIERKA